MSAIMWVLEITPNSSAGMASALNTKPSLLFHLLCIWGGCSFFWKQVLAVLYTRLTSNSERSTSFSVLSGAIYFFGCIGDKISLSQLWLAQTLRDQPSSASHILGLKAGTADFLQRFMRLHRETLSWVCVCLSVTMPHV